MPSPHEHDPYHEYEWDRLTDEGGPDPDMMHAHRHAVSTTLQEGGATNDEKKSLKEMEDKREEKDM